MEKRVPWLVLGFVIVATLMIASYALAAPKGKCVYVSSSSDFFTTGCDFMTGTGHVAVSIKNLLTDALVAKDLKGKIVPALAKSWKMSTDGLSLNFELANNAKFHDGTPVTAEDIKYSLERMMRPELKQTFGVELRKYVKSIEAVDDYHLVINFNDIYPAFLDRCAEYWGIGPKKYIEKVGDKGFQDHPVGCGPFKLIKFKYQDSINTEAVPDHYRKPPFVKDFTLAFVAEHATRMAMLKTGEADIITLIGTQIPEITSDPNLRLVKSPNTYLVSLEFYDYHNKTPSPFDDIRVRRAADYAIDRKTICEKVGNGNEQPWKGILASYHPGFDPAVEKPTPYDPEKAKTLLAEAGYPNGFKTDFLCTTGGRAYAEAVAGYLANVGIQCNLVPLETGAYRDKRFAKKLNGIGLYTGAWWVGRTHPAVANESFQNRINPWGYSATEEMSAAVVRCQKAIGEKAIEEAAKEMQKIYLEQYAQLSLWSPSYSMGVGPKVAYVEGVAGWPFPGGFEYIKMK